MTDDPLDQLIRFERRSTTTDPDYGTPIETWDTVAEVWANVREVLPSKGESLAGELRIAERPARVRFLYRDDITSAMRIVLVYRANRVLKIVSQPVEIGGRRRRLELMAADYSTSGDGA